MLNKLTLQQLHIPFKVAFSHASATRSTTESVLVTASSNEKCGYGEACPRSYVTQETFSSVEAFFNKCQSSLLKQVDSLSSLRQWANDHVQEIDQNPAAWCAIELACLDLFANERGQSVEQLLGLPQLAGEFAYTAVLGECNIKAFGKLLEQYQVMGFSDFKLKLSGKLEHDKQKCDLVAAQCPGARIRLDANNLWTVASEVMQYIEYLQHPFFAIEEPLKVGGYDGMSKICKKLGIKVILDESFLNLQQLDNLIAPHTTWIPNIRISKMGGLLRSLAILEQVKQRGIQCIVGAQVGETSLLTRVALTAVNAYRDVVIAQEGACGTYLLAHDIFAPVLMFSKGGKIKHQQLEQLNPLGFGLDINSMKSRSHID